MTRDQVNELKPGFEEWLTARKIDAAIGLTGTADDASFVLRVRSNPDGAAIPSSYRDVAVTVSDMPTVVPREDK